MWQIVSVHHHEKMVPWDTHSKSRIYSFKNVTSKSFGNELSINEVVDTEYEATQHLNFNKNNKIHI